VAEDIADGSDTDHQAQGDDEQQIGWVDGGSGRTQASPEQHVGNCAAARDEAEKAFRFAGIEDVAGEGPKLQHHKTADDVDEDEEAAKGCEPAPLGNGEQQAKPESTDHTDRASGRYQLIAPEASGQPRVERGDRHQDEWRENEFVRNGAAGKLAEEQGTTRQLAGNRDPAADGDGIDQHSGNTPALAGVDAEHTHCEGHQCHVRIGWPNGASAMISSLHLSNSQGIRTNRELCRLEFKATVESSFP